MGLRLIDILKYLGMLCLIFLLIMSIRIVINGGITSHDTPPKSQVSEGYCKDCPDPDQGKFCAACISERFRPRFQ